MSHLIFFGPPESTYTGDRHPGMQRASLPKPLLACVCVCAHILLKCGTKGGPTTWSQAQEVGMIKAPGPSPVLGQSKTCPTKHLSSLQQEATCSFITPHFAWPPLSPFLHLLAYLFFLRSPPNYPHLSAGFRLCFEENPNQDRGGIRCNGLLFLSLTKSNPIPTQRPVTVTLVQPSQAVGVFLPVPYMHPEEENPPPEDVHWDDTSAGRFPMCITWSKSYSATQQSPKAVTHL